MAELAARLWCEDEGQALTEYALALILIALVMITSMRNVASGVCEAYTATAQKVARVNASGHDNDARTDDSSSWSGAWQPGLSGSSQAGSGTGEDSSNSLTYRSLR